jgi:general secretion pathway protein J
MARAPDPTRPARHRRGFTLIEVMVALAIMALMAAMAWQGVSSLLRSRDLAQDRMERLLRLQAVMGQWEADLQEVLDTGLVPGVQFDGATLRLTRQRPDGVEVVAWALRGDRLQRWTAPVTARGPALQEAWFGSLQLLGNENAQLQALEGLTGWQVYYWRQNAWSNAQSSGDSVAAATGTPPATPPGGAGATGAPSAAANREALPEGVRLVLRFAPGSGFEGSLTRDVRLGPQARR